MSPAAISGRDSSSGWSLASAIHNIPSTCAQIAGALLADVLRTRIFEPAGMIDTLLRPWDSDFLPNSATLHMIDQQGRYTRDYMGMELGAAGGMVLTMDDMLRWLKHIDAPVVGTAETWKLMKEPHRLANGTSTGYGLGLISGPYRGVDTLSHSGGVLGGNSQMIKVRSAKLDISIAANRADVNSVELANRIIDACVEGLDPVLETPTVEAREGVFLSRHDGCVIELTASDDMQLVGIDAAPAIAMTPDSEGALQWPPVMAFMKQHVILGETAIRMIDFGNEDELDEIEREPDATLGALAATYACDALDLRLIVSDDSQGPRLKAIGRHGAAHFKLEPIRDRIWKAATLGPFAMLNFFLTFDADGHGASVRAPRLGNIRFRRVV